MVQDDFDIVFEVEDEEVAAVVVVEEEEEVEEARVAFSYHPQQLEEEHPRIPRGQSHVELEFPGTSAD
jgi:hypothetical protein